MDTVKGVIKGLDTSKIPKGSIIVIGGGVRSGKTQILKMIEASEIIIPQNGSLVNEIKNYKKDNSTDSLDAISSIFANDIPFEEIAAAGWRDVHRKKINDSYGIETSNIRKNISVLLDDLTYKVSLGVLSAAIKANMAFEDSALIAKREMDSMLLSMQSASERIPLNLPEPKCGKFHNNLRSQLNTGGIKWMK